MSEGSNTLINISGDRAGQVTLAIVLMLVTIGMLMWVTISQISLRDTIRDTEAALRTNIKDTKTEVRILQMHVQDQNAILIREGIKRAGDSTTGPTDPERLEIKENERNRM